MGGWVPGCIEGYQFQLSGISGWLDLIGSRDDSPVLGRVPKKRAPVRRAPCFHLVAVSPACGKARAHVPKA